MRTRIRAKGILLFLVLALMLCFEKSTFAQPIVITNSASLPPLSFLDDGGEPQGLLIDLWSEWAKQNDHEIEFVLVDWNASLELVRDGNADIHAGLLKSASREATMDFSNELFQLTTGIFISTSLNTTDLSELKNYSIGVTEGGFEEDYLRNEMKHSNLKLFGNNRDLVTAARDGRISFFVADYPVGMYFLHRFNAQEKFRLYKTLYSKPLCAAVKKGNSDLLALVNNGIRRIDKSEMERIEQKWIRSEQVLPSWFIPVLVTLGVAIPLVGLLFYIYVLKQSKMQLELTVAQRTKELQERNVELENALAEVRTLSGFLPICAQCKKLETMRGPGIS